MFDWVICDSPAGIERGATLAMRFADAAIIVTNPEVSSVRDSDRIIGILDAKTRRPRAARRMEKHLLITRYDRRAPHAAKCLSIDDVLEILSTPLLGIVPESEEVLRASNLGSPVTLNNPTSAPARAYLDAARRLMGEDVEMTIPTENRDYSANCSAESGMNLFNLFKRRGSAPVARDRLQILLAYERGSTRGPLIFLPFCARKS